ncbi:MAG TPA: hypothetical protein VEA58_13115 [Anaerovoracaceae bacterium]|nr:hypothetical protein [Anaerovoracaceae bacterium]
METHFDVGVPLTVKEVLAMAYNLATQNENLKKELEELKMSTMPEVLLSHHIRELMGWSKSTLSMYAQDPSFPHLDGAWKKGETIRCLRSEFYHYMKNRRPSG